MTVKKNSAPKPEDCEQLKRRTKCDKGYRCLTQAGDNLCAARDLGMTGFLECLDPAGSRCRHAFPFGNSRFCRCPIRVCLEKERQENSPGDPPFFPSAN